MFQVVKMMIVVVVIFAVCWLPFHVYFIVTSYLPEITNEPYIQEVYLVIYWLAMSNSMYNPIIYCWMNSRCVINRVHVDVTTFDELSNGWFLSYKLSEIVVSPLFELYSETGRGLRKPIKYKPIIALDYYPLVFQN